MNGEWTTWKGTRRGSLHVFMQLPNQDAMVTRLWPGGALCMVADGVGSAPLSHVGAHTLCRLATARLVGHRGELTQQMLDELHREWLTALPGENPHDFSTTCRMLYVSGNRGFLVQVGDGGTLVLQQGGVFVFDEEGKHAFSNMTSAVSAYPAPWCVQEIDMEAVLAVFLMTDGLYDDICSDGRESFARSLFHAYQGCTAATIRKDVLSWLRRWPVLGLTDDIVPLINSDVFTQAAYRV